MIRSRTFQVVQGQNLVHHPSLSGVRVLGVKRSGTGLVRVALAGTQGNRQFAYTAATIYIDASNPLNAGETIWVLYET